MESDQWLSGVSLFSPPRCKLLSGGLDSGRILVENRCNAYNLDIRLRPLLQFNSLPHRRNGFHSVTGVESRRIDLVFEPWAIRQSIRVRQRPLGPQKFLVDTRGDFLAGLPEPCRLLLLTGRALLQPRESVINVGKIQE